MGQNTSKLTAANQPVRDLAAAVKRSQAQTGMAAAMRTALEKGARQ